MPAKMKIRSAYATLPAAERKVADFILTNPEKASLMVINEIAEEAHVSVPSVTRLAKKLGYNGFLDFRVALATGNAALESLKSEPIKPGDNDETVIEKMFLAYMRSLEDTLKALDREKLSSLARRMVEAKRIFFFGAGNSSMIAEDVSLQMNMLGYEAIPVSDPSVMEMYCGRFSENDVFVGISRSGRTKLLIDSLKAAKRAGAYCAFISNYVNSPASENCDAFFCTARVDDLKSAVGRESSTATYALLGVMCILVARHAEAGKC